MKKITPNLSKRVFSAPPTLQGEAARIFKNAKDAITTIETSTGSATGFVTGDGTVLVTVTHCFSGENLSEISTRFRNITLRVTQSFDTSRDVAVFKLSRVAPKRLTLASKLPSTGSKIYVIGTPLGFLHHTISEGIVSGVRRTSEGDLLQITAPVSPGSSGSPVLNSSGQVVGMVVSTISEGQQLNFAISAPDIRKVMATRLPTREQRIRDLVSKLGGMFGNEAARKLAELNAISALRQAANDSDSVVRERARYGLSILGISTAYDAALYKRAKESGGFIYIPAGEFLRGSDWVGDESPSRRIYLDAYWIGKYPVTVAQYRQFCRATNRSMPYAPRWDWIDDHPMVKVTWHDAVAYADWVGGRLPTEAEWEKAARGTDGREYPWGNVWDPNKCHCSKKELGDAGRTAPVGSYPSGASPYGVMDMAGNVWEWCSDWYGEDYYKTAPSRNPQGPSWGRFRVLRGGSWYVDDSIYFRCACRVDYDPNGGLSDRGFRVARRA